MKKGLLLLAALLHAQILLGAYANHIRYLIARTKRHQVDYNAPSELIEAVGQIRTTEIINPDLLHEAISAISDTETFPEVTDNEKILHASIDHFIFVPGFIITLQKLLTRLNTHAAKGHLFELSHALHIRKRYPEETITSFNKLLCAGSITRELDLVTPRRVIECKNIDWARGNTQNLRAQFKEQSLIAAFNDIPYQIHTKQEPPKAWREWFKQNNIHCFQVD